jgi:hypothetical protein
MLSLAVRESSPWLRLQPEGCVTRADLLDSRSLPPEGGSHPERLIHTLSKPEVFYPRCYDRRMMLLDRELSESMQNGRHA